VGEKMKVVFMGTPEFACPTLKALIEEEEFQILEVYTQPDRRKGRGKKVQAPPVKELALKHGLKVVQPESLREKEVAEHLKTLKAEVFVVVAYGQILTEEHLSIPRYGAINVHASLLPKYRGAAPIHWALINGETTTGITTMQMDAGLDTGDMLMKREIEIGKNETLGELHDRLSLLGAETLIKTLKDIQKGAVVKTPQKEGDSSYAPKISKETEAIDWKRRADEIHNLVRGLNPFPKAETTYRGQRMKVLKTEVKEGNRRGTPGKIVEVSPEGILVETGSGVLRITSLQMSGKKAMSVKEYLAGNTIEKDRILGDFDG